MNMRSGARLAERVDQRLVERRNIVGLAARDEIAVDLHFLIDPRSARVAHGITAPPAADTAVIGSLQNLQGAEFDKAYIEKVAVGGHQKAVELFRKESETGNDTALKAAATKALPIISHHYEMAQQLAKAKAAS